jgi:predicted nucleotidyltransferase component of viral defense system
MDQIVDQMIRQYNPQSDNDRRNAIKEVVQEIVLCGLSRAGFFKNVAFYGGTALRIFYGLDRFSEDLDFSLKVSNPAFSLDEYLPILDKEIRSYGLNFRIETKVKTMDSDIESAFLKGNTKEHMLMFFANVQLASSIGSNELIKIKFEIDTNPPGHARFETKFRLLPIPYEITLYDQPSLFAGKIHAVICRSWKNRVKGRDLYDYVFYLSKGIGVNMAHLHARLVHSGHFLSEKNNTIEELKSILCKRFENINYEQAKQDIFPFIRNSDALNVWSADFFCQITENLRIND